MWNDKKVDELERGFLEIINNEGAACFIHYLNEKAIGFAQCQLRIDYVEGTHSSPIGYLEGIYIDKEYRNNGYAKELLYCCEQWAKDKKCVEFASDCELTNEDSWNFHMSMGFEEANRIICFKKNI